MGPLDWYESFKNRLTNQDVLILSGNIYDRFPIGDSLSRLNDVLRQLAREARMLQGSDAETFLELSLSDSPASGLGSSRAGDSNPAIERFVQQAKQPGVKRCYYFENFSANFARTADWQEPDWLRHNRLIGGVVDAANAGSKVIFVFPSEAWIPAQFLQSFPSVCRFHIPWPTGNERRMWFASVLEAARVENLSKLPNRAAGLTDGLSWVELGQLRGHVVESAQKTQEIDGCIRLFRHGIVKDYWKDLRETNCLRNAKYELIAAPDEPVLGQEPAVEKSVRVLAKASYDVAAAISPDYRRPRGVLFFVGPTGVGKTMLAKKLAELIFGSAENCIVLDMSEYNVEHAEARLVGAPPGYVGYSEGGQLTSAIRQKPFSVVLFDEIDKAHPTIFKKFLQILDEGRLTDGKGQVCDFSQSLIIFTSNQCSKLPEKQAGSADKASQGGEPVMPSRDAPAEELAEYYQRALSRVPVFEQNPEILNRIGLANIVPFRHIGEKAFALTLIANLIAKAKAFFLERHGIDVRFIEPEALAKAVLDSKGSDFANMGLRNVKQQFEATILELIAQEALLLDAQSPTRRLYVSLKPGGGVGVATRGPRVDQ